MAKDINIHVKTPGAPAAKQQLDELGRASQQVGQKTTEGQKQAADSTDKSTQKLTGMGRVLNKLKTQVLSFVGAYAGLQGVRIVIGQITRAIRTQIQAIEEYAQIASEQQKKLLALQAMGAFFEEHPEARKEVAAYAVFGRRPFEEVAGAWYALESKGAGLTKAQKEGIMREALELGRMEPEADLKSIIDVFSIYAKETRQKDINQVQNVIRQTLSQAGAELSQMGQYLPRFLSLGIAGGLTGAETAGLWAFATTRAPTPEMATVGIRNIFAALQGKGTPESQKILKQLGITPEMNIFEQLATLSAAQRAGKFGVPEAETLAGRENIAVLLSMLTEPTAMMETVRQVTEVARPDIDIAREKLEHIMSTDEIARREEEGRRLDIIIKNIKGADVRALRWKEVWRRYEIDLRKRGYPEWRIKAELGIAKTISGMAPGLVEPSAVEEGVPIEELPTETVQQIGPVIINDNSVRYNPVAGSEQDRGIGARFNQD